MKPHPSRRSLALIVAGVLALLFLSTLVGSVLAASVVTVTVTSGGSPLANAQVDLIQYNGTATGLSPTLTGSNGQAALPLEGAHGYGTYLASASKFGYVNQTKEWTLTSSNVTTGFAYSLVENSAAVTITTGAGPSSPFAYVDGAQVSLPATEDWLIGSVHNVTAAATFPDGAGNSSIYAFSGWQGGQATRTLAYTVSATATLTADYQTRYLLTERFNATEGALSPKGGYYNASQGLSILATPAAGFHFVNFTIDGIFVSTTNPLPLAMTGPHLVAVRQRVLLEQWVDRVQAHTDLKVGDIWRPKAGDEVFVLSYQAAITKSAAILKALGLTEWGSRTVDEVQHFPGDYVSKMAFIPARYCIGLTASPWREDGRESYIYALSGRPIGLSWEDFKKMGTIRSPDCHVWIVKDEAAKLRQLDLLVRAGVKTVVFSDHIDPGKAIAKRFDCRFFYGQTKENYTGIKDALATKGLAVVSRIGDEGMSLPELECVIDFDFNYGSRMQSMQRFGRLLHSMEESVDHHVIMPIAEYGRDKKRLYSIYEKGFKIKIHREGVTDKQVERAEAAPQPRRAPRTAPKESVAPVPLPSLPAALTGRLPGIGATINRLLPVEKAVVTVILANPEKSYSVADLALVTGLAQKTIMNGAHFGKLLGMKLVKKAGTGRYEAAV